MNLKKAAIINALGKYSTVVIQLLVTAILSRILSPEDYGVVAIITVFTTFFNTLANMGFGTAIIQRKDLSQNEIEDIFSVTFYISLVIAFLFSIFSFVIAWFYKSNIYIPISLLLSISIFFEAFNMVPNGILNRDKKFVTIAIRTVSVYTFAAIFAIVFAKIGFRYYSLVIQTIIAAFLTFIWNYSTVKIKFKLKFNRNSIRKVANYSGFQFAFNFVNYFASNLDNLLTGKFFGSTELGYYNKAYSLTLYPVNNLTGVITPVLHPILSDFQDKKEIMYKKYMHVIKLLSLIGIFVESVCILCSSEIITIMFGDNWNQSATCFRFLSICILFRMINSSSGGVFQALGNTKLLFENGLLNTVITVVAILLGIFLYGNIQGLALCVGIAYIIHYLTASSMLIKMAFKFKLREYYKELWKEVVVFFIMILSVLAFKMTFESFMVSLLVKIFYLTTIYSILLVITKEYRVIFSLCKRKGR